jgi:hypothetical protein
VAGTAHKSRLSGNVLKGCVRGGRWEVVANNDRERYLQGHASETPGYLFVICSTLGHMFMSLFHCACIKLRFDVFSRTVVRTEFFVG